MQGRRLALLPTTLAVLLSMAGPAAAATFHVDDDAPTGSTTCTQGAPCDTIMEAVVAARSASGAPHVVSVAAGLYEEAVNADEPSDASLRIIGAGSGSDPSTATIVRKQAYHALSLGVQNIPGPAAELRHLRVIGIPTHDAGTNTSRGGGAAVNSDETIVEDVVVESGPAGVPDDVGLRLGQRATLDRVRIRVQGSGGGIYTQGDGPFVVRDSDIASAGGPGLEVRSDAHLQLIRSRVAGAPGAEHGLRTQGTLTSVSSLISGGRTGLVYFGGAAPVKDAVLTNVTIDAGQPGVADPLVVGENGRGRGMLAVQGGIQLDSSIVLERSESGGNEIRCTNSDVPHQVQAATGPPEELGPINCPSNAQGNSTTAPSGLFLNGVAGDYRLLPGPAVDSGAPGGLAPGESLTDLAGAPRVLDGDCTPGARRDKGAYERGPADCTAATTTTTVDRVRPIVSAVSITNRRFRAGLAARRRAPVGTTVRYRLSEAARVTFTVQRPTRGRRVKRKCRKASRRNRRARRCTRYVRVARFAQNGKPGRNSRRFKGVVKRRKLRPGRYRMIVQARDAAGNLSKARRIAFRIVKR